MTPERAIELCQTFAALGEELEDDPRERQLSEAVTIVLGRLFTAELEVERLRIQIDTIYGKRVRHAGRKASQTSPLDDEGGWGNAAPEG